MRFFGLPAWLTASLAAAFLLFALHHLGWLTRRQPWEIATGWNRIAPANRPAQPPQEPFALAWLGHSSFILRWEGLTLILDPHTAPRCTVSPRQMEFPEDLAAAGRVDAVLISHAHYDHLNLDTLCRVPEIERTVVPAGVERYFGDTAAHAHPEPTDIGDTVSLGPLEIIPVPAAHNGNRFHPWRSRLPAVGYIIRSATRTLYYAGDTALHNDFAGIRDRYHPDIAILPIGAFAPRFPLKRHHLSPEEAVAAAQQLGVDYVIPCHFGTFTLSLDRPATALPRFAAAAQQAGLAWAMPRFNRPEGSTP